MLFRSRIRDGGWPPRLRLVAGHIDRGCGQLRAVAGTAVAAMVFTENVVLDRTLSPTEALLQVDEMELVGFGTPRQIEPHPNTVARWKRRYLAGTPQQRLAFILHYVLYWPKMVVRVMEAVHAAVAAERQAERQRNRRRPRARRSVAIPIPDGG